MIIYIHIIYTYTYRYGDVDHKHEEDANIEEDGTQPATPWEDSAPKPAGWAKHVLSMANNDHFDQSEEFWGIYCKANVKESRQKVLHGISKVPEHILNEMKPLMGRKETWEVIKTRPNFFVVCRLRVYCGFAAICLTVYNSLTFKSLVQSVVQSMSIYLFRTARSENWGSSARSRTIKLTSWTHYNIFQHIYCTVHNIHVYIYIFTHMYMLCIEIIYLYL